MPGGMDALATAVGLFRENSVAICTHDRRLWIWIWMANCISTASLAYNVYTHRASDMSSMNHTFL